MARHSIVDKLYLELQRPIETEMQVVYILVELRKMLEHDGKKKQYPVLNMYGNWAVHTKLSGSDIADRIVRLCDQVTYRKINENVDIDIENEFVAFFDESLLRRELQAFLEEIGLPTEICTDTAKWHDFRKKLASIIEDSPLELKASKNAPPTHFIKGVIVKNKSTDKALHVEWEMVYHSTVIVEVKDGKMKVKQKLPIP
jgi:hypothetical protein